MSHSHMKRDYRLNLRLTSPEKMPKFIIIQVCENEIYGNYTKTSYMTQQSQKVLKFSTA